MTRRVDPDELEALLSAGEPPEGGCAPGHAERADFRIVRDGTWLYHGSPIGRKALVGLFASVLMRDAAGDYWLVTPVEKVRVEVDDAPFLAVEMRVKGRGEDQALSFRTNVGEEIAAGPEHPIRMRPRPESGEPAPYLALRDRLDALISRAVYYDMVELGVEREIGAQRSLGVWSGGAFFALGALEE